MTNGALFGEVVRVEQVAPRMRRVVFGGPGMAGFEPSPATDAYVNILFPPDDAPYGVPFDVDEIRALDPALRPKGRRYTIRRHDADAGEVAIDFVMHGDVGYAGRWALHAQPGDRVQMLGPSGGYAPDPAADWYLMVGDESALPAIAASIERVAAGSLVVAVLVVDGADDEVDLSAAATVREHWVHRDRSGRADGGCAEALVSTLESLDWPAGVPDVFVHGEAEEVRAVRRHLVVDRGIERDGASISPYWRRGQSDEDWRAVKRQWVTAMEAER